MMDFKIPAPGEPAPSFCLKNASGSEVRLEDHRGKWVVLYFYPKDNTPGCTIEAQEFRNLHSEFEKAGCVVAGVSRDSLKSHDQFACEQALPFPLISDADETLCRQFGVLKEKNMYGKMVLGIERSTFVIGADSVLKHEWRGVKAPGHAQEVLEFVKSL